MPSHQITLEQLADLNTEIAALVRAGVPMEAALPALGRDIPGRLGKISSELGRRMEQGGSLLEVVQRSDDILPPTYRAVVVAGIRSGNLAAALEGLSTTIRRVSQLRRLIGVSLVYPFFVLALAYGMFVWTAVVWAPSVIDHFHEMGTKASWLKAIATIGGAAEWWAPWLPPAILVLLVICWRRSRRRMPGEGMWFFGLPVLRRAVRCGNLAAFADVLRLLVEREVPLDEAIVVAAEASGAARLSAAAREMADRIRRGENRHHDVVGPGGLPPMLAWLIENCREPAELAGTLRLYADSYHRRAIRAGQWATIYLPILLSAGLGGVIVALLAVGTLGPWFELLYDMATPD